MTRSFERRPVELALLEHLIELATWAPSAGKTQGWHAVALRDGDTERFWRHTLPAERRSGFRWQGLLDAPVILLPFADASAYTARYSEPDKAATGLGTGVDAWPAPYWTIDASMAVMTILLGAEDAGLGALFFGVFKGERELRRHLGVPPTLDLLGAIALGCPSADGADEAAFRGRSAGRPTRTADQIVHLGRW
jgi:nitroreductase